MGETPTTNESRIELSSLPYWFAIFIATLYATGFLTEYTFLNALGIKDDNTDAFKAKYIYVGILCLQCPATICILLLVHLSLVSKSYGKAPFMGFVAFALERWRWLDSPVNFLMIVANRFRFLPFARLFLGSLFAVIALRDDSKAEAKIIRDESIAPFYWSSTILMALLVMAFYITIGFARQHEGTFYENKIEFCVLFLVTIFVPNGIRLFEAEMRSKYLQNTAAYELSRMQTRKYEWHLVRWLLVLIALGIMFKIFYPLCGLLWQMLIGGGYLFFAFMIFLAFHIRLCVHWASRSPTHRGIILFNGITFALTILYFAILLFSFRVYPFIPVSKGGGDYTTERMMTLEFQPEFSNSVPPVLVSNDRSALKSIPLYILHESPEYVFVAANVVIESFTNSPERNNTNQMILFTTNGPIQWRDLGPLENKPRLLFAIKKEEVLSESLATNDFSVYITNKNVMGL